MVLGKRKGNTFENKIYKDLRAIKFCQIQKSLGSGNTDEPGDLLFHGPNGNKYVIECKHYKKLSYRKLEKFYSKTANDIVEKLDIDWKPIIIYRINNTPIMCYLQYLGIMCSIKYVDWKGRLYA